MSRTTKPLAPLSKHTYFCGLDLSLTGTGIVIFDAAGKLLFATTFKNNLIGMERLEYIRNCVMRVLVKFPPKFTCIEGYSMGGGPGRLANIGELGGVVKLALHQRGFMYCDVPPTRLKKFVFSGGKAEKSQMMMKVLANWGHESKTDDEADAYGLGRIALSLHIEQKLSAAQKEVIKDIKNPPVKKKKKKKGEDE